MAVPEIMAAMVCSISFVHGYGFHRTGGNAHTV
jgi:hypothetical protein